MKKMMKMLMGVSCALLAGTVVAEDDPARGLDGSSVAQSCVVRIGTLEYTTAAWTSGDGSETNAIKGVGFVVQSGTENVKVIFTAGDGLMSVDKAEVDLGTVTGDITFGVGNDYREPSLTIFIPYLDYDASTGTFTNAVRECELLSNGLETRPYTNGWYYVRGEVTIPAGRRFEVAETNTVHLILCDGARLRILNQGDGLAAVKTTGGTLVIYGQEAGTGMIVAEGGGEDANLPSGAGIGGDINCPGGTVTINGGTVIAQGGKGAAGIGGGNGGSGGTVTINGGKVMAKGGTGAEDIGHGAHASGSGTLSISGGLFWEEPKDDRIAQGRSKALNLDWATKADYPWAVGVARTVTIGDFPHGTIAWTADEWTVTNAVEGGAFTVLDGTANVKVIFTADPGYELVGAAVVNLGTVTADIAFGGGSDYRVPLVRKDIHYLDWDEANGRMTNAVAQGGAWTAVSESTQVLKGCAVVTNDVTVPFLDVSGATCLILCNDATLTVTGADGRAGIHVPSDASLTITVQKGSSGQVVAQGGANCAGIGSQYANGEGSGLGTVKIVAGTVKATGGVNAAGIGNGNGCGGGRVTIRGGKVTAVAGSDAALDIGAGASATSSCEVSISGGFFARKPQEAWLESGFKAISNKDEPTRIDYPWSIVRSGGKYVLVDYDRQSLMIDFVRVVLRSGDAEVYSEEVDLDDAEDEAGRLRVWVPNDGVIIVGVLYTDKFGGMHPVSREFSVDTSASLHLDKLAFFEAESVRDRHADLFQTLDEALQSGVGQITLLRDVNDATGNYHIPRWEDDGSGQTQEHKVVIDLNGFTVNGLGKAPLFVNEGTLTIRDSSSAGTGRLTNYSDDKQLECGGCVLNYGVFTLESGVIEKCSAKHFGGGIMGMADSETYIRGGEIRLCEANEGSAVYSRGRFEMTGGAVHETMKLFQRQLSINGYDYRVAISGGLLGCALDDLSCLTPTAELLENTDSNTRSDYPYCIVDPMVQEAIYEVVNVDQAYFATHSTILEANRIYRFVKDVSLAGSTSDPALASALSVTNGTVVLYLDADVTVSLTGAVADGRSGAGLRVPRTATVVITGEGTLIAQGGERGGTGAAAAIGGCGGLGGADASSGEDMGLVFTMGQVKIKATSCLATEKGGSGGLPTCAIGGGGGGGNGHFYVGEEVKVECGGIDWANFVILPHYWHGAICRQMIVRDEKDIEVCCVEACLNEPLPEITWALLGPKENIRGLFLANGDDSAAALWYNGDLSPRKPRYETDDLGDVMLKVRYGNVVAILGKGTENERKFETLAAAVDEANYGDTISVVGDVQGENVKVPIGMTVEVETNGKFREPMEDDLRHKYYKVTTRGEGGKTYYTYGLNEEMVVPRFGSSDGTPAMELVRDEEGKTVSVRLNVENVYEDLYYTVYWGPSPHPGEMVPVTWECANEDGTIRLQAPADDESGFYQIRVTDHLEWLDW
ncbi:MAG: hypothetical protein KBT68_01780 [bacterium]|nr:hypothetical protein [Candidatus Colisoma equi]